MTKENKYILIIDDERWYVQPIIDRLEALGFKIEYRRNIERGLSHFKTSDINFTAIIADLMLPYGRVLSEELERNIGDDEMNGLYLIKEIKKINDEIPVFCYTVVDDVDVAQKIKELGAIHFAKATTDDEKMFDALLDMK